jgi:antitoxin (DNA-binding transcriptional repressor) of toxin-antitoxin stability system
MSVDGAILLLSDMHFGRDLLDPPELPVISLPKLVEASKFSSYLLRFFEKRCLGHSLDVVLSLPLYLQYLMTLLQGEGYGRDDFDCYAFLGDQVTIPDPQSYRFLYEYLTEYEYEGRRGGAKLTCPGLRIDPKRVIAIPGNHDKLLRTDLSLYDQGFTDPLNARKVGMQRSQIVIRRVGSRDVVFILVDANAYASSAASIGSDLRDHLACGRVSDGLLTDLRERLQELSSAGRLEEDRLQGKFQEGNQDPAGALCRQRLARCGVKHSRTRRSPRLRRTGQVGISPQARLRIGFSDPRTPAQRDSICARRSANRRLHDDDPAERVEWVPRAETPRFGRATRGVSHLDGLRLRTRPKGVCNSPSFACMKEIGFSEFKVKCSAIIEQVRKTRQPIRVTRLGKPLAEIVPPSPEKGAARRLGSMAGTMRIIGDIVGPTGSLGDWNAAADVGEKEPAAKKLRKSAPRKSKAHLRR